MISARDVFQRLDFEPDWEAMTDLRPAYRFTCGSFSISAAQVMGRYFEPCFLLGGVAQTKRSRLRVNTELPLQFASFEQGLAWIVHSLGPDVDPSGAPTWYAKGLALKAHLPWNMDQAPPRASGVDDIATTKGPTSNLSNQGETIAIGTVQSLAQVTEERDLLLALLVRFGQSCVAVTADNKGSPDGEGRLKMVLPSGHCVEWSYSVLVADLFLDLVFRDTPPPLVDEGRRKAIRGICARFDQNRPQIVERCIPAAITS